jgi:hypothetical protein
MDRIASAKSNDSRSRSATGTRKVAEERPMWYAACGKSSVVKLRLPLAQGIFQKEEGERQ